MVYSTFIQVWQEPTKTVGKQMDADTSKKVKLFLTAPVLRCQDNYRCNYCSDAPWRLCSGLGIFKG